MDMLSLDRLIEQTKLVESLSANFVDESDYNVVTKKVNETSLMEAIDAKSILKHGRNLMGLLEADDTEASPAPAPAPAPTQPTQPAPAQPAKPIDVKVTFDNGNSLTTRFNGTKDQATAYYVGNQFNLGSGGRDVMTKGKAIEVLTESVSVAKIDTLDKFLNAKPVSQQNYVEIKTEVNKDAPLDEIKVDTSIEKNADKNVKEVQKKTEDNKEWADNSKGTNELKTKLEKFEKFVTSLETEETKTIIKKITDKIKSL